MFPRTALFWLSTIHFAPNEGEGGSGGASGDGGDDGGDAGDQQHRSGAGDAGKTGVTESKVNELITKALNSRLKDFGKQQKQALDDALKGVVDSIGSTLDEKLQVLVKAKPEGDDEKPHQQFDVTKSPEFKKLARQSQEQAEELRQIREREAQAVAKSRATELRSQAVAALTKAGVDPNRVQRLAAAFIGEGTVTWNEDHTAIEFKSTDGAEDLESGVRSWAASDEGKLYLPPRGASGSGDGARKTGGAGASASGGVKPNGASSQPSDKELGQALQNMLRQ